MEDIVVNKHVSIEFFSVNYRGFQLTTVIKRENEK